MAAITGDPVIGAGGTNPLTSTSNVAVYRAVATDVAICQEVLEGNFDNHIAEVKGIIAGQNRGTVPWYAYMAMRFQYGDSLPAGSDVYSPVAAAGDPSLIVTYAVAQEVELTGGGFGVRIKVATGTPGALSALSGGQLTALTAYFEPPNGVKYAGVELDITSEAGDNLQCGHVIYYDALVLNAAGQRIDGTSNTPVIDAINAYLFGLSFTVDPVSGVNVPVNEPFDLNEYVAAIMAVPGVVTVENVTVQAHYAATPYVNIMAAAPPEYVADSGYLVLDTGYWGANVTYTPYP